MASRCLLFIIAVGRYEKSTLVLFLTQKKIKSIFKNLPLGKCGDQDKIVFCFYSLSIFVSKFKTRCTY